MSVLLDRLPTTAEYLALRESVGWKVPAVEDAAPALERSIAGVVAETSGEVVAMGRTVGDGALYTFVVDLVVHPSHQGAGLGSELLAYLERMTRARSVTGLVQLVADGRLGPFYERSGYLRSGDTLLVKRLT